MSSSVDDDLALFDQDGEPTAHARRTDPETSHEAARSIRSDKLRASQEAVLDVLRAIDHGTDVDLIRSYNLRGYAYTRPQSESGIRTRRAELVAAGKVVDTGERATLPSGRRAIIWKAAS